MKPVRAFKMTLTTTLLLICSLAAAAAQLFAPTEEEKASLRKRVASLGPAHLRMCTDAIAAKYKAVELKASSWVPYLTPYHYRKVGGWPEENQSLKYRYQDSMVIMAPKSENPGFDLWYGAPSCYFGREGGAMRLLTVCTTGTQGGPCRVPNPIERTPQ